MMDVCLNLYIAGVDAKVLEFETLSGVLKAERDDGGFISMDLPLNAPVPQDYEELSDLLKVRRLCQL